MLWTKCFVNCARCCLMLDTQTITVNGQWSCQCVPGGTGHAQHSNFSAPPSYPSACSHFTPTNDQKRLPPAPPRMLCCLLNASAYLQAVLPPFSFSDLKDYVITFIITCSHLTADLTDANSPNINKSLFQAVALTCTAACFIKHRLQAMHMYETCSIYTQGVLLAYQPPENSH